MNAFPFAFAATLALAASAAGARPATCYLAVGDSVFIDGPCNFDPQSGDGSFQIADYDGRFFAYVNLTGTGVADGWWNDAPYSQHAHTPLGTLYRNDACWSNSYATVCAW
jgi:hypothetical protein